MSINEIEAKLCLIFKLKLSKLSLNKFMQNPIQKMKVKKSIQFEEAIKSINDDQKQRPIT